MVPNSPIHPDAAMRDDGSRETSPTKGNKTPGRKLSPPKHLATPIVEVTENDSSEENREQPTNPDQAGNIVITTNRKSRYVSNASRIIIDIFCICYLGDENIQNGEGNDTKEQNGQSGDTNEGLSEPVSEDEIITDMSQLNNGYDSAAAVASGIRKSIPDIPETIAE